MSADEDHVVIEVFAPPGTRDEAGELALEFGDEFYRIQGFEP
jgi:hypothetical protein